MDSGYSAYEGDRCFTTNIQTPVIIHVSIFILCQMSPISEECLFEWRSHSVVPYIAQFL